MLEDIDEYQASFNILDRDAFFRKQFRVGILYVKHGQSEESEVLANSKGSNKF